MLFDKDYDASLWFILKSDKKNRKEIIEFLKDMPEVFLERIRESIEQIKKDEFDFDGKDADYYKCHSRSDSSIYYYFQIDKDNALTITMSYTNGSTDKEMLELMIFPMNLEYVKKLGFFEGEWIGTLTNNIRAKRISSNAELVDCNENEYNIYNTPVGCFISYSRDLFDGKKTLTVYKPLNTKKIPEEIEKEQIFSKNLRRTNKKS